MSFKDNLGDSGEITCYLWGETLNAVVVKKGLSKLQIL